MCMGLNVDSYQQDLGCEMVGIVFNYIDIEGIVGKFKSWKSMREVSILF